MTRITTTILTCLAIAAAVVAVTSSCPVEGDCEGLCGTVIIHARSEVTTLYPPAFIEQSDLEVADQIFNRLADLDTSLNTAGDAAFTPRLARSWEFEDDVTLRFDLAQNATWHDGTPVTAADVVFTFETYADPATNASSRTLVDRITRVEARDEHTAVFTFSHAYVEQFFDATHYMRILPKHLLDSIPAADRRDHSISATPVGSGPYRFVQWVPNDRLELNAVDDYFEGPPGIARLIWLTLPIDAIALDGLEHESVDVIPQVLGPPNHQRADEMENATKYPYPSPSYGYFAFNFTDPADRSQPHPIFSSRDVRRAIAMAVDRQAIATTLLGDFGSLPHSLAPPLVRTNSIQPDQIPFDPDAARQLLETAGWTGQDGGGVRERRGIRLSFEVMTPSSSRARANASVLMQEYLAAVGVEMGINEVPLDVWLSRSGAGEFSAAMGGWAVDPSPAAVRGIWTLDAFTETNWTRYHNPEFDRLVEQARNERNPERESELWHRAYSTFNQDAAAILLYSAHPAAAVHNRITNVSIRGDEWAATLWTWQIDPNAMLPRDRISRR